MINDKSHFEGKVPGTSVGYDPIENYGNFLSKASGMLLNTTNAIDKFDKGMLRNGLSAALYVNNRINNSPSYMMTRGWGNKDPYAKEMNYAQEYSKFYSSEDRKISKRVTSPFQKELMGDYTNKLRDKLSNFYDPTNTKVNSKYMRNGLTASRILNSNSDLPKKLDASQFSFQSALAQDNISKLGVPFTRNSNSQNGTMFTKVDKDPRKTPFAAGEVKTFSPYKSMNPQESNGLKNTGSDLLGMLKSFKNPLWGGQKETDIDKMMGNFHGMRDIYGVDGYTPQRDGLSKLSPKELEIWKQSQINEASKNVRFRGDNVNPFDYSSGNEEVKQLRKQQSDIFTNDRINKSTKEYSEYTRKSNAVNKGDAIIMGDPNKQYKSPVQEYYDTMNSKNPYTFEYGKEFRAAEGVNGYGLGLKNYMNASRAELMGRGMSFLTGTGGLEALKNSFGIATQMQKVEYKRIKERGVLARLMNNGVQAKLGLLASVGFTTMSYGDPSEIVTNQLSYAAGLQGWRIGSSFGGVLGSGFGLTDWNKSEFKNLLHTSKTLTKAGLMRGGAGLIGGITGFGLGIAAVQGASALASDMITNESKIRKIAKDFTTRTATMDTSNTRQSLTIRQQALNKLARSGLNDRAMLLGNESRVLKGIM